VPAALGGGRRYAATTQLPLTVRWGSGSFSSECSRDQTGDELVMTVANAMSTTNVTGRTRPKQLTGNEVWWWRLHRNEAAWLYSMSSR
jgi:hypothetical protein